MSKKPKEETQLPTISSYILKRDQGAWVVIKFTTKGDKVTQVEQVTQPDMLPIAQSKLLQFITKDNQ